LWGAAWMVGAEAEEKEAFAFGICVEKHPFITKSVEITEGSTYGVLMERSGVGGADATAIFSAAEDLYDLSKVRLGRAIDLRFDRETGLLKELSYQIDSEERLHVVKGDDGWTAERRTIQYEVRLRTVEGTISSSLYASALSQGLDDRAIVALADVFQWMLDFSMDVKLGDSYRFIYEERFLDGKYVMPGEVKAAKFVNAGKPYYAFSFTVAEGKTSHFDETGESLQKMFLKAPVAFKYISSGFTTGLRYVQAFNTYTGHRAIDYAAPTGTPIRSVGDGTVVRSGWNGGYGNFVSVRHNGTYTTNYAHMSRIAVRYGQKVTQGETIGYVGSTGFSTGPHLHYEMVKNGVKINPLREDFPGVDPVPTDEMEEFMKVVEEWRPLLD
jgi:murein DD-endopeptidase MepM/ murein hydrolase activator NlpD